ncbi:MAG TPA: alpha amylase C-terminal domain-containing protein, partial [Erythrobacter sp.]|nr:alpha amylase C-terminal domain-containing protein [Erythrobacter sp.]
LIRDLNRLYRSEPALHARDCEGEGFEWLIADDARNSVFAWLRKAPGAAPVAVIANMTPAMHGHYRVPLPHDGEWVEVLNSDAHCYGGSGQGNQGSVRAEHGGADIVLPPLATIMLRFKG